MAATADKKLQADEIHGLNYFKRLLPLLDRLHESGTRRDMAGNRKLFFDDYAKLVLLYLFNPLIDSMRTLQEASMLNRVGKVLGVRRFSLGSFSEACGVFDPGLLKSVIEELAGELKPLAKDPRLAELRQVITLADSTVLAALPKLVETTYGRSHGGALHGWRLHTHLPLDKPVPDFFELTSARGNVAGERRHLREHLQSGRCYVMDRGYHSAAVLNAIHAAGSNYVMRVQDNLTPQVHEERLLGDASLAAGVLRDALVSSSVNAPQRSDHPLRLVEIEAQVHPKRTRKGMVPSSGKMLILTDLLDEPPELIALIYRQRWTIELFFRMLKQLLGCRHLLSQRQAGIDIQIHCAVIAVMLIHLQTGAKPNKPLVFVLGMYLAGWASEDEVLKVLNRPDRSGEKLRAKDELWKKLGVH